MKIGFKILIAQLEISKENLTNRTNKPKDTILDLKIKINDLEQIIKEHKKI